MIYILGSILTSCILVILFRIFQSQNIALIQAITINYWVCVICGYFYNLNVFQQMLHLSFGVYFLAILQGFLFIFMFFQIGKASQQIGLSYTGLFGRISVIIPVTVSILFFQEKITNLQGLGILLAILAIYFLNTSQNQTSISHSNLLKSGVILFLGNGIIDTIFKFFSVFYSNIIPQDIFILMIFGTAGFLGCIYLIFVEKNITLRNIIAGIFLGVPNFFSLIFMLNGLKIIEGSKFFPLNNIGIILLLTFVGATVFKEKIYPKTWIGLFFTVCAILLISEFVNFN